LILALDRRVPDNVAELRAGRGTRRSIRRRSGLFGRTLGLLGVGSIGQEVIRRAAAFGMDVVIWSRRFAGESRLMTEAEARELGIESALRAVRISLAATPEEVAARADILSVHLALGPETRGMIGAGLLARMKPGAFFVNTSRGEVVDHAALASAVREKGLRVGLDVFANEPAGATGEFTDDLLSLPERLWHAPHRRVHEPGAGGHRRRNRPDRAQLQGDGARAERREPGEAHGRDTHARRAAPRSAWCAGPRVPPPATGQPERAGDGEHRLRRGEAAVARVNLDGEPSATTCSNIKAENADILDLQVVRL
jgi:D-3-phosphoglycerate dehydrogenase / 2-oxoglutarate reductase